MVIAIAIKYCIIVILIFHPNPLSITICALTYQRGTNSGELARMVNIQSDIERAANYESLFSCDILNLAKSIDMRDQPNTARVPAPPVGDCSWVIFKEDHGTYSDCTKYSSVNWNDFIAFLDNGVSIEDDESSFRCRGEPEPGDQKSLVFVEVD